MTGKLILPLTLLLLAACGPADDQLGPGGVSAEDAKALDEAAAKLDGQNSASPDSEGTSD